APIPAPAHPSRRDETPLPRCECAPRHPPSQPHAHPPAAPNLPPPSPDRPEGRDTTAPPHPATAPPTGNKACAVCNGSARCCQAQPHTASHSPAAQVVLQKPQCVTTCTDALNNKIHF